MASKKISTTLRIDNELYKKIKFIADRELRSINAQLEYCVLQCVRDFEEKYGQINLDK